MPETRGDPEYDPCRACRGMGRTAAGDCRECRGRGRFPANAEARAAGALRELRREQAIWAEVERESSLREQWGPIFGGGY